MAFEIFHGAPDSNIGRFDKEMRFYRVLEELSVPFSRIDHSAAFTMEECYEADSAFGVMACKNLFLCNRQQTVFYLLLMPGDKPFKTKELSGQLGVARLSFASGEKMEEYLGLLPGSVSVMGLMHDKTHAVRLLIDKDLTGDAELGCHPCINTASMAIAMTDILQKFLPATGHTPTVVTLLGE
jgi:Ala-tRNA(Pro) deacylase